MSISSPPAQMALEGALCRYINPPRRNSCPPAPLSSTSTFLRTHIVDFIHFHFSPTTTANMMHLLKFVFAALAVTGAIAAPLDAADAATSVAVAHSSHPHPSGSHSRHPHPHPSGSHSGFVHPSGSAFAHPSGSHRAHPSGFPSGFPSGSAFAHPSGSHRAHPSGFPSGFPSGRPHPSGSHPARPSGTAAPSESA
ncbi:hypothetical protein GSI_00057 [Ganoderma sinense ZZ0214-1]|uniref:Uncharacterized protein n=1 Tax=Ganoderma sinense ZZ0214-1 TaxID=1077348 RepID=A0A2G8SRH5_9APHY|nr:hypothetical protein GSI_00057 [Ganoderma sinense ZZ0214-1]